MKTSTLNKARWLQTLTLASRSPQRVTPWITSLRFAFALLLFLTLGVGNAWGATETSHTCSSTSGTIVTSKITWSTSSATWNSPQCRMAANSSITFTLTGVSVSKIVMGFSSTSYVGTWTSSTGSFSTSSTNVTWTGSAGPGTLTFTTSAAARLKTIKVTHEDASSYTITVSSNNNSWGTVSGTTTITASPADCYQVVSGTGGYTLNSGTATITHTGTSNTLSVTPTSNCSITVNFEKKTVNTYIDEIQDNGETEDCDTHSAPTLSNKASATSGTCAQQHWHFAGWTTASYKASPEGHITAGGTSMTANGTTYYAVWSKGSGSDPASVSGGDMPNGVGSTGWTTSGTGTYSGNGVKFDGANDYIQSPDLSSNNYKALTVKLKAGHNGGSGSVLTIASLDASSNVIDSKTLTPSEAYNSQSTTYSFDLSGSTVIKYIRVTMTSKTNNLGMKYCEVFTPGVTYSDYICTCCESLGSINGSFF